MNPTQLKPEGLSGEQRRPWKEGDRFKIDGRTTIILDEVTALIANAAYLAGQASTPEKPGLAAVFNGVAYQGEVRNQVAGDPYYTELELDVPGSASLIFDDAETRKKIPLGDVIVTISAANQHTPTQSTESVRGGWRAIESAPKAYTRVLLANDRYVHEGNIWEVKPEKNSTQSHGRAWTWAKNFGDPTHWMPLPSPPTTEPDPKAPRLGGDNA